LHTYDKSRRFRFPHMTMVRFPVLAFLMLTAMLVPGSFITRRSSAATPPTSIDLFTYVRVGRFSLPEPTRTAAPPNSLLAQEASGVTYNWDTDTLFVVGDGGTSVVQVTKTGKLIDSMTLAPGGSPQGTEFFDTEGISYVGGGKFVLLEERYRQANLFTYIAGATLQRADVKTVKLGTTIGNIGLEGVSYVRSRVATSSSKKKTRSRSFRRLSISTRGLRRMARPLRQVRPTSSIPRSLISRTSLMSSPWRTCRF
jgi:uncharacterized protein YjiK